MTHPLRAIYRWLGFKDRVFTRCPRGEHRWVQNYGDARLHYRTWNCLRCPASRDE